MVLTACSAAPRGGASVERGATSGSLQPSDAAPYHLELAYDHPEVHLALDGALPSAVRGGAGAASVSELPSTLEGAGLLPIDELTLELWVRGDAGVSIEYAAPSGDSARMHFGRELVVELGAQRQSFPTPASDEWQHVVVTWRGRDGSLRVYVDGELAGVATMAEGASLAAGGRLHTTSDASATGAVDELAWYEHVMPQARVISHWLVAQGEREPTRSDLPVRLQAQVPHAGAINAMAYAADGSFIVTGGQDARVKVWDALTGRLIRTLDAPGAVFAVAVSPDQRLVAAGGVLAEHPNVGAFAIWDVDTGERIRTRMMASQDGPIVLLDGGRTLRSVGSMLTLDFDVESGEPVGRDLSIVRDEHPLAVSPDGAQRVVRGLRHGAPNALVRRATDGRVLHRLGEVGSMIAHASFSENGKWLAFGGTNVPPLVVDRATGTRTRIEGFDKAAAAMTFSDGELFLAEAPGQLFAVNPATGTIERSYDPGENWRPATVDAAGPTIATLTSDGVVFVFDRPSARLRHRLECGSGRAFAAAVSASGRLVASGHGKDVCVWDAESGKMVTRVTLRFSDVMRLLFRGDDELFVGGDSVGAELVRFSALTGERLQEYGGVRFPIKSIAFTRKGASVVVGNWDSRMYHFPVRHLHSRFDEWDVRSGERRRSLGSMSDGEIYDPKKPIPVWQAHHPTAARHDSVLWAAGDGKLVRTSLLDERSEEIDCGFTPPSALGLGERSAVAVDAVGKRVCFARTGEMPVITRPSSAVANATVMPGDAQVLLTLRSGGVMTWTPGQGRPQSLIAFGKEERAYVGALDPQGKTYLAGASTGELTQLDLASREPIGAFAPSTHPATAVEFAPSASLLAVGRGAGATPGGRAYVWDLDGVRMSASLPVHRSGPQQAGPVTSVSWSGDGQRLLAAGPDGTRATVWEVATGDATVPEEAASDLLSMSFQSERGILRVTPDGTSVLAEESSSWSRVSPAPVDAFRATASTDGGRVAALLRRGDDYEPDLVGFEQAAVYESGSGDTRLFLSEPPQDPRARTIGGGLVADGGVTTNVGGRLKVAELATGRVRWALVPNGWVTSLELEPSGRRLVSVHNDKTLRVYEANTGKLSRSFPVTGRAPELVGVDFANDRALLLEEMVWKVRDLRTGRVLFEVPKIDRTNTPRPPARAATPLAVVLHPSGAVLEVRSDSYMLVEPRNGRVIERHERELRPLHGATLSPKGRWLAETGPGYVQVRHVETNVVVAKNAMSKFAPIRVSMGGRLFPVGFSPREDFVAIGTGGGDVRVHALPTGESLAVLQVDQDVFHVAFDGPDHVWVGFRGALVKYRWRDGTIVRRVEGHRKIYAMTLSPDGRHVAVSGYRDGGFEVDVRHVDSGRIVSRTQTRIGCTAGAFTKSGRLFACGGDRGRIALIDVGAGGVIARFEAHEGRIRSIAFSADDRRIASAGDDGTVRVFDRETKAELTMVSSGEEWIVYAPNGDFEASASGGELVTATVGTKVYGVDQIAALHNRPERLVAALGGSKELQEHLSAVRQRRLAKLGVDAVSGRERRPHAEIRAVAGVAALDRELEIELRDNQGLASYQVYINNVALFAGEKPVSGKRVRVTESIRLTDGLNKIEVSARNSAGVESFRALHEEAVQSSARGELYYLGFGVSDYVSPAIPDLSYAHKDALDLAAAFGKVQGFSKVHTKVLTNAEVTPPAVADARGFLSRARPGDTVVLFVAGHGLHDGDEARTYYFLSHAAQLGSLATTAVPFDVIEGLVDGIGARNKLVLIDTCESGEDAGAPVAMKGARGFVARVVPRKIVAQQMSAPARAAAAPPAQRPDRDRFSSMDLRRRTGAIVLSSALGSEAALESKKFENGAFTEAILKALGNPRVAAGDDGVLSVDELRAYVSAEVPNLTEDQQHPTVDRDNIYQKFGFGLAR